ncbi:hypothetical protein BSKO_07022 [Bryopsis sp. KO-2023]|nr:hypothetical protein BSKO_07022 [Bryopsis sp. KO-2023]
MRWILPACCSGDDDFAESGEEVRSRPKDVTSQDDAKWDFPERLRSARSRSRFDLIKILDEVKREDKWRERLAPSEVSKDLLGLLTHSLNDLLSPFVESIEEKIEKSNQRVLSWETACIGDVFETLQSVARKGGNSDWRSAREALGFLLEMIAALWNRRCTAKEIIPNVNFESLAVNRLVSILQIIWFRQVSHSTTVECRNRWSEWERVKSELHTRDDCIAVVLNFSSKATLLHLLTTAKFGEAKSTFTVRRYSSFIDALSQATKSGLLNEQGAENNPQAKSVKIFPSFVDDALTATSVDGGLGNGGGLVVVKEGGEGHGPRREFFEYVGQTMGGSDKKGAMAGKCPFLFNRSAGAFWLNADMEENEESVDGFRFAGWLLGQSIHNRCHVGIQLPELFFQRLIDGEDFSVSLAMLEEFDEEAARAIKNVMKLDEKKFKNFLTMESLPASCSRSQYGENAAEELLIEKTGWQMTALSEGFYSAIGKIALQLTKVVPSDLQKMICGNNSPKGQDIHIQKTFRIVVDVETSGTPMPDCLWKILESWESDMKKGFLKFVTGSAKLPLPETELLRIEAPFVALTVKERKAHLGMLPQLMKIMEERLSVAVTSCVGYDLDELSSPHADEEMLPHVDSTQKVANSPVHPVHPAQMASSSGGEEPWGDIYFADGAPQRMESIGFNSSATTIKEIDQMLAEMDADPNFI